MSDRGTFPMTDNNNSMAAVSVKDLRKSFGPLEVLKGVSLEAQEGDVISILGSSGSGKSTMLRCINMLEVPDSGEIRIAGEMFALRKGRHKTEPTDRRQVDRLREHIGMVFQSFNLWSHMTILENVIEAPVHVQKRNRAECVEEAEALLERVGIADKTKLLSSTSVRRTTATCGHRACARAKAKGHAV